MLHRVFGIRHHGPGSARSLRAALEHWQPDCVLIEGPPEADGLLALAADAEMKPPVAILAYATEAPQTALFYPFADFSPEWVAIRWAQTAGAAVRFFDLPLVYQLETPPAAEDAMLEAPPIAENEPVAADSPPVEETQPAVDQPTMGSGDTVEWAWQQLCEIGGFADPEALWDRLVETRSQDDAEVVGLFAAVSAMMAELRQAVGDEPNERDRLREAYMRQEVRRALKAGHERIAVVCGAWHAPVLQDVSKGAKADAALLKGLAKSKISVTWIPWTHGRLTRISGYGAGVASPGWYRHLFFHPHGGMARWLAEAAQVFRRHDLEIAPSHVIEAVRLADCLAALRGYAEPALDETLQAIETIYCAGDDTPLRYLADELLIDECMGTVPASVPDSALSADLKAAQKRLRLKPEASRRELDLDLRKETDLARSHLLHRLVILGIPWGRLAKTGSLRTAKGTFHELWWLGWEPDFAIRLIEAGRFGNTLVQAAHNALLEACTKTSDLGVVADLLQQALQADLSASVPVLTQRLDALAAGSGDVPALMRALTTLAPVLRYGDVRKTDIGSLNVVLAHYAERICIGLPITVININDDLADELSPQLAECDSAMRLLSNNDIAEDWQRALRRIADSNVTHPLLAGRSVGLLMKQNVLDSSAATLLLSQALSPGVAAAQARWLEGLLADGGLFLIHDTTLLALLDDWLTGLAVDQFDAALPLIRRAFSAMSKAERRQIGEVITAGGVKKPTVNTPGNEQLLHYIAPLLIRYLGLKELT